MLERLGLVVDLIPAQAQLTDQKRLQKAMAAHDSQRSLAPAPGQAHAAVAHVLD